MGGGRLKCMGIIQFIHTYEYIITLENLLEAWRDFVRGKRARKDVQEFELDLMSNIISLHKDLADRTYNHSSYQAFNISDPKPRNIHKASVRDRLVHRLLYRMLYTFFDRTFIPDSYSCRKGKGLHKAINQFRSYAYKASQNHTKTAWVLQCDIKKFFASIDQSILMCIIQRYIPDLDIRWLIAQIIESFHSTTHGKGLPLGNLTSQLLVNVYMNKLDQFVKNKLKAKFYIRYADDFIILSRDKKWLEEILSKISDFLWDDLRLQLHPDKILIRTIASGVDFLGWIHFPDHRVIRTSTRKRMFCNIESKRSQNETVQSYLGLLGHGNANKLRKQIEIDALGRCFQVEDPSAVPTYPQDDNFLN